MRETLGILILFSLVELAQKKLFGGELVLGKKKG